jgi:membrane fusion protein, multidrug efflux system
VWVLDRRTMTVNRALVSVRGVVGNLALIEGGLESGVDVVTAGVHVLTPGKKVKLYLAGDAAAAAPALPLQAATPPES